MTHINSQQHALLKLILLNLILLIGSLIWYWLQPPHSLQIALAKGSQLYTITQTIPGAALNAKQLTELALNDTVLANLLHGKEYDFLQAIPLSTGEARYWQDQGCSQYNCEQP